MVRVTHSESWDFFPVAASGDCGKHSMGAFRHAVVRVISQQILSQCFSSKSSKSRALLGGAVQSHSGCTGRPYAPPTTRVSVSLPKNSVCDQHGWWWILYIRLPVSGQESSDLFGCRVYFLRTAGSICTLPLVVVNGNSTRWQRKKRSKDGVVLKPRLQ